MKGRGFLILGDATLEEVLLLLDVHHFGEPREGIFNPGGKRGETDAFKAMMLEPEKEPAEQLDDLEAFQGVAKFPVRVKCATLAWHVLEEGLEKAEGDTTETILEIKE